MTLTSKPILMIFSVAMIALNALPILSVHCGGSESCTLMVRGYNLLEFSCWSAIPVFTAILILGILYSEQKRSVKNAELLFLLGSNLVCYIEGLRAARAWLVSISDSLVMTHSGLVAFPIGIVLIIFYAMFYVNVSNTVRSNLK